MVIQGKVVQVLPLEQGVSRVGNAWKKASVIVEYGNGDTSHRVKLSNMKDADAFTALPVGMPANFYIDVQSREYAGRWYTEVNCWKWDVGMNQTVIQ